MKRCGLVVLALLLSCAPCDEEALPIDDGTYTEQGQEPTLTDAEMTVAGDVVEIEYTGDDGNRYVATYAVVERSGG